MSLYHWSIQDFPGGILSRGVSVQRGLCPGVSVGGVFQTPPVRLRAGGTHPTGMHSFLAFFLLETAWNPKKLDREGRMSLAPLRSATVYVKDNMLNGGPGDTRDAGKELPVTHNHVISNYLSLWAEGINLFFWWKKTRNKTSRDKKQAQRSSFLQNLLIRIQIVSVLNKGRQIPASTDNVDLFQLKFPVN